MTMLNEANIKRGNNTKWTKQRSTRQHIEMSDAVRRANYESTLQEACGCLLPEKWNCMTHVPCQKDLLTECLTDWLASFLPARLPGWLAGWPADWLTDWRNPDSLLTSWQGLGSTPFWTWQEPSRMSAFRAVVVRRGCLHLQYLSCNSSVVI